MRTPDTVGDIDVRRMPSDDLAALLKISSALASTLDLASLMQMAIGSACDVMGLETGAIYLMDGDALALRATTPPLPPDFPDHYRYARLEDYPHVGLCLSSASPVWVADAKVEPLSDAERGLCESRGLRSLLFVPLTVEGESVGAFIVGSTGETTECGETDIDLCRTLAHQISLAVANAQLHESLIAANIKLACAYDATLEGWAATLEMRDRETKGHADRVEQLTMLMVQAMGIPEEEWQHVRRGTLLHDIGKMVVPDVILQKPGPLDDAEWDIMRQHPIQAYELLSGIDFLKPALDIPYCHHERWDGTGYPRGLAGEGIPLVARIFAIVDVYDALTSDRPYRDAWTHERAVDHIREQSGHHFDPDVVEAFLGMAEELDG